MHVTVKGIHLEVTQAIREYAQDKLGSLSKFAKSGSPVGELEVKKTTGHHVHGDHFVAELHIQDGSFTKTVHYISDSLYNAIDGVKDMAAREMTNHAGRTRSLLRRGQRAFTRIVKLLPGY